MLPVRVDHGDSNATNRLTGLAQKMPLILSWLLFKTPTWTRRRDESECDEREGERAMSFVKTVLVEFLLIMMFLFAWLAWVADTNPLILPTRRFIVSAIAQFLAP